MFRKHMALTDAGQDEEAKKYVLYGVRPDTGGGMRDVSVEPLGDPKLDFGVNPRLCFAMRKAIDSAFDQLGTADAVGGSRPRLLPERKNHGHRRLYAGADSGV